jgi:hypothetical protein
MDRIEEIEQLIKSLSEEKQNLMKKPLDDLLMSFMTLLPQQKWICNNLHYPMIYCDSKYLTQEVRSVFCDVRNHYLTIPDSKGILGHDFDDNLDYWTLDFFDINELVTFVSKHQMNVKVSQELTEDRRVFFEKELQALKKLENIGASWTKL